MRKFITTKGVWWSLVAAALLLLLFGGYTAVVQDRTGPAFVSLNTEGTGKWVLSVNVGADMDAKQADVSVQTDVDGETIQWPPYGEPNDPSLKVCTGGCTGMFFFRLPLPDDKADKIQKITVMFHDRPFEFRWNGEGRSLPRLFVQ